MLLSCTSKWCWKSQRSGGCALSNRDVLAKEGMGYIAKFARVSEDVVRVTVERDSDSVTKLIEQAHDQEIALLRYNNEAGLSALVSLMYLLARNRYEVVLEKHAGKGYADMAFVPVNRAGAHLTPFMVELKVVAGCETAEHALAKAMKQIKDRNYSAVFHDALIREDKCVNSPLAVGIAWDPHDKVHLCAIDGY